MADSSPLVVPLRSKRQQRALTVQKLNHLVPAFGLLLAGQQAIGQEHGGFGFYLGMFEVVSALVLIVLTARELRAAVHSRAASRRAAQASAHPEHAAHPSHHVHGVDWVDIAAGFVLVAEALETWHVKHHIARPTILTAIITFTMGLSHGRLAAISATRRVLRVTAEGLAIPGRPFKARKLDAHWSELQSIEIGERWAAIATRTGRVRRLDLRDLEGEQHVRSALLQARQRLLEHGVAGSSGPAVSADTAE